MKCSSREETLEYKQNELLQRCFTCDNFLSNLTYEKNLIQVVVCGKFC